MAVSGYVTLCDLSNNTRNFSLLLVSTGWFRVIPGSTGLENLQQSPEAPAISSVFYYDYTPVIFTLEPASSP
eukprot:727406-Amorphochlora_amoeboformis.AAC.1